MRHTSTLPTGTYRVRFSAYCGLSYEMGEQLSRDEARDTIARLLRRRRRTGHPVSILESGTEYEIGEPEDCALIPDTAGLAWIEPETAPAFDCYHCGFPVLLGESCDCQNQNDDDEPADASAYQE
jgi:hypothetical protein